MELMNQTLNGASPKGMDIAVLTDIKPDGSCFYQCIVKAVKGADPIIKTMIRERIMKLLETLGIEYKEPTIVLTSKLLSTLLAAALVITDYGKNKLKTTIDFLIDTGEAASHELSVFPVFEKAREEDGFTNAYLTGDEFYTTVFTELSKPCTWADTNMMSMLIMFLNISPVIFQWDKSKGNITYTETNDPIENDTTLFIPMLLDHNIASHYTSIRIDDMTILMTKPTTDWLKNTKLNVRHDISMSKAKAAKSEFFAAASDDASAKADEADKVAGEKAASAASASPEEKEAADAAAAKAKSDAAAAQTKSTAAASRALFLANDATDASEAVTAADAKGKK